MKTSRVISSLLAGLWLLTACYPPPRPLPTPEPRSSETITLPTPAQPGQVAHYGQLQVEMRAAELTAQYLTRFGSTREPPTGTQFLWVDLRLKNTGPTAMALPAQEHFSALFGGGEFKSSYGHRQAYPDYTSLKPVIYPGQTVEAWLRFEIPAVADLNALQVAFLPESIQISLAFSPDEAPWGEHPIYLWNCSH